MSVKQVDGKFLGGNEPADPAKIVTSTRGKTRRLTTFGIPGFKLKGPRPIIIAHLRYIASGTSAGKTHTVSVFETLQLAHFPKEGERRLHETKGVGLI